MAFNDSDTSDTNYIQLIDDSPAEPNEWARWGEGWLFPAPAAAIAPPSLLTRIKAYLPSRAKVNTALTILAGVGRTFQACASYPPAADGATHIALDIGFSEDSANIIGPVMGLTASLALSVYVLSEIAKLMPESSHSAASTPATAIIPSTSPAVISTIIPWAAQSPWQRLKFVSEEAILYTNAIPTAVTTLMGTAIISQSHAMLAPGILAAFVVCKNYKDYVEGLMRTRTQHLDSWQKKSILALCIVISAINMGAGANYQLLKFMASWSANINALYATVPTLILDSAAAFSAGVTIYPRLTEVLNRTGKGFFERDHAMFRTLLLLALCMSFPLSNMSTVQTFGQTLKSYSSPGEPPTLSNSANTFLTVLGLMTGVLGALTLFFTREKDVVRSWDKVVENLLKITQRILNVLRSPTNEEKTRYALGPMYTLAVTDAAHATTPAHSLGLIIQAAHVPIYAHAR